MHGRTGVHVAHEPTEVIDVAAAEQRHRHGLVSGRPPAQYGPRKHAGERLGDQYSNMVSATISRGGCLSRSSHPMYATLASCFVVVLGTLALIKTCSVRFSVREFGEFRS